MAKQNLLYVGVKGSVVAFDKVTGQKVWESRLGGGAFVNVILDGDQLFAHTNGALYALAADTGRQLWQDGLSGLGYGHASLVTANAPSNSFAALAQRILHRTHLGVQIIDERHENRFGRRRFYGCTKLQLSLMRQNNMLQAL